MCVKSILQSLTKSFHSLKQTTAFTLTEIMIVIILLGVIAAFAMPDHTRSKIKAYEKSMAGQLQMLSNANSLYKAKIGTFLPTGAGDINTVNNGLNLNLVLPDTKITFSYSSSVAPNVFSASMTYNGTTTILVDEDNSEPCCSTGDCSINIPLVCL